VGFAVAFVSAIVVVHVFVAFLQSHSFGVFGRYRVVIGLAMMLVLWHAA